MSKIKELLEPQYEKCPRCSGTGRDGVCKRCEGNGRVQSEDGGETIVCPACEGDGKNECPRCGGTGEVEVRR
jgi:DnaJ-class molecular chaperone